MLQFRNGCKIFHEFGGMTPCSLYPPLVMPFSHFDTVLIIRHLL